MFVALLSTRSTLAYVSQPYVGETVGITAPVANWWMTSREEEASAVMDGRAARRIDEGTSIVRARDHPFSLKSPHNETAQFFGDDPSATLPGTRHPRSR